MSVVGLVAGFTGSFYDYQLIPGRENLAIYLGIGGIILSIVLRMIPSPETKLTGYQNTSPLQVGFASQFKDWTSFEDASKTPTPDWDLDDDEKLEKLNQLRIELASYQGLLDRKIGGDGLHYIRFRKR
jgi:hypothetical protein